MYGKIIINDVCYHFFGNPDPYCSETIPLMTVKSTATKSIYTYIILIDGVQIIKLEVIFTTPAFLDNIEYLSLPITYIDFNVTSLYQKY